MYRAFNLVGSKWDNFAPSLEAGTSIFETQNRGIRESLEGFINDGIVDAATLNEHWFPLIEADVFISHSHIDKDDALTFAGWVSKRFGLKPFVDSCIWGNAEILLRLIDNRYCLMQDSDTYNYKKRNNSTSHVHMMLSSALSAMIDKCECAIFMNTPHSITSAGAVERTQSPWLFLELGTMRIIRRRDPERLMTKDARLAEKIAKGEELVVRYPATLKTLTRITDSDLAEWECQYKDSKKHPLDLLYEIAPE